MSVAPTFGVTTLPTVANEPMRNYEPGSADRAKLKVAMDEMAAAMPFRVPCIVNGRQVTTGRINKQINPADHSGKPLCEYHEADAALVQEAIEGALKAKQGWANLPWNERAAVFMKAADLIATKYRYKILAATALGQAKNCWQGEIDAAAETCDFLRFGCTYVQQLYAIQPTAHAPTTWNRMEYRPLEGFVLAISPFNFTAIGANLTFVPAVVGNVTVWKPSPMAVYSNYLIYQIFKEAGLPDGIIQFLPGPAEPIVGAALAHRDFAGLHFTGSTFVFRTLWKQIAQNVDKYRSYPRIVGETGGKNFHLVLKDADVDNAVHQSIRGAFEYQGQKCSALSRLYVPKSMWENSFKAKLLAEIAKITLGPTSEFEHFMGPVIARHSYDKIMSLVDAARKEGGDILCGGTGDDSVGFFIQPTVIETKEPRSVTMVNEIFGPVLTVYAYPDDEPLESVCETIDTTTEYALTGSVFGTDREAISQASNLLRNSSGMWYTNSKCTGAVVGQQPFGGARGSGTNDKAGSMSIFYRFISARTIKEEFLPLGHYSYPHMG
ncbi:putative delta-1-pyrroline-5-carboxylate dehydrogenase [Tilletiaria anomala UBC 951]|uniref:Multifunctional fusion protein n=1 Tax=Tilletiaria anomala (strain ATCC 24038 / CBS 436.72 / UBC 951) TaxID=1037660 RepID=A0A066V7V8_TILAU|nr:putative delta-1-pyrroline-5-carboxylate dehydrogenase [Tilletiaria anomala UBC 951]KDN37812.1 putative delta-1-pyrroline-5-carboxylate dehydrogenase [Tilletiaria anomala UBC 951]